MKGKMAELSNSWRFFEGQVKTGYLEDNGKLTVLDDGQTVWNSWKDYVREVQQDTPTKGGETEIVEQLSLTLGMYQAVDERVQTAATPLHPRGKEEPNMAVAAKKAVAKTAKPKVAKEQKDCLCGCGTKTGGNFAPGHDSKVHSIYNKIKAGTEKRSALNNGAFKYMQEKHG